MLCDKTYKVMARTGKVLNYKRKVCMARKPILYGRNSTNSNAFCPFSIKLTWLSLLQSPADSKSYWRVIAEQLNKGVLNLGPHVICVDRIASLGLDIAYSQCIKSSYMVLYAYIVLNCQIFDGQIGSIKINKDFPWSIKLSL